MFVSIDSRYNMLKHNKYNSNSSKFKWTEMICYMN